VTGAEKLSEKLQSQQISNEMLSLPKDRDINDFFLLTADPKTAFMNLFSPLEVKEENPVKEKTDAVIPTDYGFILKRTNWEYEVRGIVRRDTKLKATIKGEIMRGQK